MVFSSPIFLFYFLPCLLALYFLVPRQGRNLLLLSGSLLFYAWGEGFYLLLMLVSIALNYGFGLAIQRWRQSRWVIAIGVALNLAVLISWKYANFIVDSINWVLTGLNLPIWELDSVHLPLGISFFTFQALSYLIDIRRGEVEAQRNPISLGLYIAMFPQLIAGPIVRYSTINAEIISRRVTPAMFAEGVERFVLGLSKKLLIANPLGSVVDTMYSMPIEGMPTHVAWFLVILYGLQIYFDFSGYSDMAIGLGRMFGFRFLENFNYPYKSKSIREFWQRWHMSLSTWFRDYLYIPLGGNRKGPIRTYINLSLVFVLCGLWHGAAWTYFIWGAAHGVVLCLERAGLEAFLQRLPTIFQHAYFHITLLLTWVLFRMESIPDALVYYQSMFAFDFSSVSFELLDALKSDVLLALIAGLLLCVPTPLTRWYRERTIAEGSIALRYTRILMVVGLLGLCAMQLATATHNPFIYFRF